MKKNITINLCGRLFQIDEDAYEMLQQYIESLRSFFGRQEGCDEIVDDIEARIAELFDELKGNGIEAITIDHVKNIITRIGKPEQMAGDSEEKEKGTERDWSEAARSAAEDIFNNVRARTAGKRLYRNPNDKMVAGVMSGLAAYTNTDVTWWRLGIVLLTLCYGTGLIAYIILAIVLPQANSPQEQLQMQGKIVTPQNLADAVVDDQQPRYPQRSGLREIFSVFLKIIIGFFVVIAVFVGAVLGIAFLGVLLTMIFALLMPASTTLSLPFTLGGMGLTEVWVFHPYILIGFAVSLLAVLFIPVYAIIHLVLSLTKKIKPMSVVQRIVWIVLWMIALFLAIALGSTVGTYHDSYNHERMAENRGWMTDVAREYLKELNLRIDKRAHCNSYFVKNGQYFTGDSTVSYIDVNMWGPEEERYFQASRVEEYVNPGTYRISCNARADGGGVCLFATAFGGSYKVMYMVPASGNEGGNIWEEAADMVKSDSLPLAERARKIRDANNGKGFGWNHVEFDTIEINAPTTILYGISTDPDFTDVPCHAQWFSAADFKLERVDDSSNSYIEAQ